MNILLQKYWNKTKSQINSRTQRERGLLLVTGVVVIWVVMFNGFIAPSHSAIEDSSEERQNLEQEFQASKHEFMLLKEKMNKQSYAPANTEITQLQAQLKKENDALNQYRTKLIKPEVVPALLDKLLADFSGLTLQNIETLPPKELSRIHNDDKENGLLYRHEIKMTFTGEYQDLLAYVKKIEKLNYPLWWGDIEYKITNFPQAKIVLTLYTLSEHKNWIGV